jgi:hypothetical protein
VLFQEGPQKNHIRFESLHAARVGHGWMRANPLTEGLNRWTMIVNFVHQRIVCVGSHR